MTRTSVVDIDFDIDGYLERGGLLLNLQMPSGLEKVRVLALARTASPEVLARITRYGEFLSLVGAQGAPDQRVDSSVTESQLRDLWKQTIK